jgi:hypothetical protein
MTGPAGFVDGSLSFKPLFQVLKVKTSEGLSLAFLQLEKAKDVHAIIARNITFIGY